MILVIASLFLNACRPRAVYIRAPTSGEQRCTCTQEECVIGGALRVCIYWSGDCREMNAANCEDK